MQRGRREQRKEENERRIVAEIDGKIMPCKSNISVANDLTD